ncbi:MAG: hypothetical protein QOJ30_3203 [Pseudonocardiales bacterium]|jgi:catechol 2,3-dioxygenase-like lactoylglutathione lyase family enzyme|nr:hypothetical protein [Pseudonocardiales bacterium]
MWRSAAFTVNSERPFGRTDVPRVRDFAAFWPVRFVHDRSAGPGYGPGMGIRASSTVIETVTSDLAKALAFYRTLGLDIPEGADGEPHVEVPLPGGGKLAFDTEATLRSFMPDWTPPTGSGRLALAFGFDSPAEVDAAYSAIVGAGHRSELKPFDTPWGQRYATVLDPDGNGVDLFAPLA